MSNTIDLDVIEVEFREETLAESNSLVATAPSTSPIVFNEIVPAPVEVTSLGNIQENAELSLLIVMDILKFKQAARATEPQIVGVQFQCRPEVDEDEISHSGHVVYDTRYLDARDHPIYVAMGDPEMWNRIAVGRIRIQNRTDGTNGSLSGMYFWDIPEDSLVRIQDAAPETRGVQLETSEVVGDDDDEDEEYEEED